MVAIKADDVARAVRTPKDDTGGYLVHGTDPGQISDYARLLTASLTTKSNPPGEILRLSEQDISQSPGRVGVELNTIPMFGGRPVIWLRTAQNLPLHEIEESLRTTPPAAYLVVEAGNLPKTSKLRQLFESAPRLAALPCYGDDVNGVAAMVEKQAAAASLKLSPETGRLLKDVLGSNLSVARAEMEKLILFAAKDGEITPETIEAAVGDVLEGATDAVINAAFSGDGATALSEFDKLVGANVAAQSMLSLLNMHLLRLMRVRGAVDTGEPFAMAIKKLRPPLFFKAERAFSSQIRLWTFERLTKVSALLQQTTLSSRLNAAMEQAMIEHLLLHIAEVAHGLKPGRAV
ncbi:MAG: DNA polymerase III subunit delta [Chitinophagales bacterium]|nr:DNA polymerase III subunit delta [Hyphomicrobiales bacterium]